MRYKIVRPKEQKKIDAGQKALRKQRATCVFLWLRSGTSMLVLFAVVAAVLFVTLPMLPDKPIAETTDGSKQGVLELWNIECFEGGVDSRQRWLTARAAEFEKANKGLYVHVTTLTAEQAKTKLDGGEKFDIVGFSRGIGCDFADMLCAVDVGDVLYDNMRQSATFGSNMYAIPYYCGIYCLFSRQSELSADNLLAECTTKTLTRKVGKNTFTLSPLVCGYTANNSPLTALRASGVKGRVDVPQTTSQYSAYEQFVGHKAAVALLGTQRDLYRLTRRAADGKIEPLAILPLTGYTDLVQYLGIAKDGDNVTAAKEFCKYLVSDKAQSTLTNMGLFSVLKDAAYYTDETYAACEQAVSQSFVPCVFDTPEAIAAQRKDAESAK